MSFKVPKKPSQRRPATTKDMIAGLPRQTIVELAKLSPIKVNDQEGAFGLLTLGVKRRGGKKDRAR